MLCTFKNGTVKSLILTFDMFKCFFFLNPRLETKTIYISGF